LIEGHKAVFTRGEDKDSQQRTMSEAGNALREKRLRK
jgi:hypothetical protein